MRNKLIVAGVGLVGYGALWGWAVTADFYERKMKSNQRLLGDIIHRQSREIESLNEYFLNPEFRAFIEATKEELLDSDEPGETGIYGDEQPEVAVGTDEEEPVDEAKTEEIRAELQSKIDQYTAEPDYVNDFVDMAARSSEPDFTPPFVISKAEYAFGEDGMEYAKNTLTYYPREQILLDDDNDVIDQRLVDSTVGWRNMNRFGDESDDADVVFIRNHRLQSDFEVVRDTENPPPAHILHGLDQEEYEVQKAAGTLRFRPGAND